MPSSNIRVFDIDNVKNLECPRCGKVERELVVVKELYMMNNICFVCRPCAITVLTAASKKEI
jgi:hypothetical protein